MPRLSLYKSAPSSDQQLTALEFLLPKAVVSCATRSLEFFFFLKKWSLQFSGAAGHPTQPAPHETFTSSLAPIPATRRVTKAQNFEHCHHSSGRVAQSRRSLPSNQRLRQALPWEPGMPCQHGTTAPAPRHDDSSTAMGTDKEEHEKASDGSTIWLWPRLRRALDRPSGALDQPPSRPAVGDLQLLQATGSRRQRPGSYLLRSSKRAV